MHGMLLWFVLKLFCAPNQDINPADLINAVIPEKGPVITQHQCGESLAKVDSTFQVMLVILRHVKAHGLQDSFSVSSVGQILDQPLAEIFSTDAQLIIHAKEPGLFVVYPKRQGHLLNISAVLDEKKEVVKLEFITTKGKTVAYALL
ncbi:MAG: hypothetical protein WCT08_05615 [Patescibacteria group bacterium]|jgi:hypothetical protein